MKIIRTFLRFFENPRTRLFTFFELLHTFSRTLVTKSSFVATTGEMMNVIALRNFLNSSGYFSNG